MAHTFCPEVAPSFRHPRAFAATLAQKVFTNGKSDCELVAGLYADTLAGTLGNEGELKFDNCEWRDDDLEALAEALPMAKGLENLYLRGNPGIGARGWQALAAAISAGAAPKLSIVGASDPRSDAKAGLRAVQARLPGMKAPFEFALKPGEATIAVRVLADKVSAEFFVQGGRAVGTFGLPAGVAAANATLAVTSEVGELALASVAAWAMKCGWR